jgi:hypothetical protein
MNCSSARATACALALSSLLLAPVARAQAADTTHKLSGSGDIGFVNAAGNTDVTTLNVGEALTYSPVEVLRLAQSVAIVYGRTNGVESASLWQANARGDRDVGNRWGVYALLEFDRNTFASIDRRFQEGVGALNHPIRTIRTRWASSSVSGSSSSVRPATRAPPSQSGPWREVIDTASRRRRTAKSSSRSFPICSKRTGSA